jgi:conjugal transfer/entry exclusion protein
MKTEDFHKKSCDKLDELISEFRDTKTEIKKISDNQKRTEQEIESFDLKLAEENAFRLKLSSDIKTIQSTLEAQNDVLGSILGSKQDMTHNIKKYGTLIALIVAIAQAWLAIGVETTASKLAPKNATASTPSVSSSH